VATCTKCNAPHDTVIDVRRQWLTISHIGGNDALNAERDLIYGLAGLIRKVFSLSVRGAIMVVVAPRAF
jgi:hypothetical protein